MHFARKSVEHDVYSQEMSEEEETNVLSTFPNSCEKTKQVVKSMN